MGCARHQPKCCHERLRWEDYGVTWQVMSINGPHDHSSDIACDYFVLCSDPAVGRCYENWTNPSAFACSPVPGAEPLHVP